MRTPSMSAMVGLLGLALSGALSAQDLVLTNARIVDPETRTTSDGAIWIRDGRVAGVGPAAPDDAPGDRIDLGGRWVTPSFHDLHTHSFGNAAPGGVSQFVGTGVVAQAVLSAGVTSILDLFNAEDFVLGLRERQRAGELGGADILAAGPCFTATRGHCSEYGTPTRLIDSPEDARRELAELAPKRPDVVKVVYDHFDYGPTSMPTIDRATLDALVAAAREAGLKTVVHVGTWEDVRDAVLAGAAAVTHVPGGGEAPPEVAALMAERGVYHIPTLVVHTDLAAFLDAPELLEHPLAVAMTSPELRAAYRHDPAGLDARTKRWVVSQRTRGPAAMASVRRLHQAGVRMLTGTDAGNWGVVQGYSVHREMVRLVEAGLSTWDALAAATTTPGDFLGRDFGVGVGDEANLVVLEASPVEDIENTQDLVLVVKAGRVVWRPEG